MVFGIWEGSAKEKRKESKKLPGLDVNGNDRKKR